MKRLIVAACLTVLVAAPAAAHSTEDLTEWRETWKTKAADTGLTKRLVDEWVDMHRRHPCNATLETPCAPAPAPASRSTSSGVSSNVNRNHGGDVEQWRPIVEQYFGANTNAAMSVMACESGGNPNARHPGSSASGLFQFLPSTWERTTGEQYPGNVFDGASNIAAAAKLSNGGSTWQQWVCKP